MLLFNNDIVCLPQISEFTARKEPKAPALRVPLPQPHAGRLCFQEHRSSNLKPTPVIQSTTFDQACGSSQPAKIEDGKQRLPQKLCNSHGFDIAGMTKLPQKLCSEGVQDLVVDTLERMTTLNEGVTHSRTCAFDRSNCLSPIPFRQSIEARLRSPGRALSARGPRRDLEELVLQRPAKPPHPPLAQQGFTNPKSVDAFGELREEQRCTDPDRVHAFQLACARRRHWDETAAASRQKAVQAQQRCSSRGPKTRSPSPMPGLVIPGNQIVAGSSNSSRESEHRAKQALHNVRRALSARRSSDKTTKDQRGPHPPRPRSSNATMQGLIPLFYAKQPKPPNVPTDPQPSTALGHFRGKLSQSMPHKQTLDMRMRNLRRRRRERSKTPTEFEPIPTNMSEEMRERIRETFRCYDQDGSSTLDMSELRGALADLGYCPQCREEKLEFAKILEEVDSEGDGELDLKEFEQAVVRVMSMLRTLQRVELFEQFQLHDVDSTGTLSTDEVFDILPELSLAPRTEKERQMIEEEISAVDVDHSNELNFKEFEQLLIEVRELLHRMRRFRRRSIIHECGLEHEIVEAFKHEICELKDQFDQYDRDKSGFLDRSELNLLIADCGLGPRSKAEREEIQDLIDSSDEDQNAQVTFEEFLHLICGIRRLSHERREDDLRELFTRFDRDGSGSMSLAECSRLLESIGLSPKTRQEQRNIAVLLDTMDEDGSGELDFEEFAHLCQRVQEMLQVIVHQEELKTAKTLHIAVAQLHEYKSVFENLDADETGQLSLEDVRAIVDNLHITISGDELYNIFADVDEDESGFIEFNEFLKLISMVYNHVTKSGQAQKLKAFTGPSKPEEKPDSDEEDVTHTEQYISGV